MRLPNLLKRYRIGGDIYKCPVCGLLIEIKDDHKNIIGFEINNEIYGLSFVNSVRQGVKLKDASTFPTHPDCIANLVPKLIEKEGKRWD